MAHGAYTLGEFPLRIVRLTCPKCRRFGQYRRDRLIERFGPDIAMPDLLAEIAQCPLRKNMSDPCHVRYADRIDGAAAGCNNS